MNNDIKSDRPDYLSERPMASCHRGGTFYILL